MQEIEAKRSLSPRDRTGSPSPGAVRGESPVRAPSPPVPEPSPAFEKRYGDILKLSKGNLTTSSKKELGARKLVAAKARGGQGGDLSSFDHYVDRPGTDKKRPTKGKDETSTAGGGDRFSNFLRQDNAFQTTRTASTSQIEKNMEWRLNEMASLK